MSIASKHEVYEAFGDGCQNLDMCKDWRDHEPHYEPDWEAIEEERREAEYLAQLPSWPELFGFPDGFVRCAAFGRNPNLNPYTGKVVKPTKPCGGGKS